jgi:Ca-activated chloride channel family protein
VAFAGSARLVCPLTRDYAFFRWAVEGLSPADGGGAGTLIGDAIRKVATDLFDPLERRFKDLILISDGEDQESFPVDAAAAAAEQGVRIIAVGLGDDQTGSRIPVMDSSGGRSYLTYRGQEVWTRLEAETMRGIALATPGGRYLHAATGAFDLGAIYRELVTGSEGRDLGPVEITRYREQFQLFLGIAIALLVVQAFLVERPRRREEAAALEESAVRRESRPREERQT